MLGGRTVNTQWHKAATPQPVSFTPTAVLQQGSEGPQSLRSGALERQLPKPALPRARAGPRGSCSGRKSALGKQRRAPLSTARATPAQHQRPSTAERERER
ncbi:unnamed protein product [Rangifer tarandus platyrhynchus]|uniref:Uncharacterized protein n=1 Tax=Rangifer tarandus platyrhynchus TaxID=3082113 RepID=A0ACB1MJQ7_RANTA